MNVDSRSHPKFCEELEVRHVKFAVRGAIMDARQAGGIWN